MCDQSATCHVESWKILWMGQSKTNCEGPIFVMSVNFCSVLGAELLMLDKKYQWVYIFPTLFFFQLLLASSSSWRAIISFLTEIHITVSKLLSFETFANFWGFRWNLVWKKSQFRFQKTWSWKKSRFRKIWSGKGKIKITRKRLYQVNSAHLLFEV